MGWVLVRLVVLGAGLYMVHRFKPQIVELYAGVVRTLGG